MIYKAIKENKIIAINETGIFSQMTYDLIEEDAEHSFGDYILADTEYVLSTDEKAKEVVKQERIAELKRFLADSDYWTSKYCDGEYTDEEWAEKVAQRKAWREEIRELEK